MSKSDYEYLLSLPLVLHLPSEHTFLVHAGLLPYDPTLSIISEQQPLAHWPRIPSQVLKGSIPALRNAQERAILEDVKQNTNPWVVLNMRNLRKDHTVSRLVGKSFNSRRSGLLNQKWSKQENQEGQSMGRRVE